MLAHDQQTLTQRGRRLHRTRLTLLPGLAALAVVWLAGGITASASPCIGDPAPALAAADSGQAGEQDIRVVRTLSAPEGFKGHLAYDPGSKRLWLISFGPPASPDGGPSRLYELDPCSGRVLARAELPLKGSFVSPVYLEGSLYVGIFWESAIYQIAVGDRARLGEVTATLPVPGVAVLGLEGDGSYRYPFLQFSALAATPRKDLLVHANHAGELIALERTTGHLVSRVKTVRGLGGMSTVTTSAGRHFLIGNLDAEDLAVRDKVVRFDARPVRTPVATKRSRWGHFTSRPEPKLVTWFLLDPATGEVLASVDRPDSPAFASSAAVVGHEAVPGTPYGRFRFLALGTPGILELEWTPAEGRRQQQDGDR